MALGHLSAPLEPLKALLKHTSHQHIAARSASQTSYQNQLALKAKLKAAAAGGG
eukprot:CAMPEP_0115112128 /NCGR_PEP_ID=MMETSP0227-20121206/40479_1 /TAXON_ID=89957 /ORGANISM="Polarella glacialis, Strain CCMP 1383" /LENGTH=53 /DNA_ID=CAMNT_0002511683 /DNA_START=394 /DNA_END=551 /DNA_ORIENTATION=-